MIIVCPSCETSYQVPIESAGPGGRKVKCAKCSHVWTAEPPPPPEPDFHEIDDIADALDGDPFAKYDGREEEGLPDEADPAAEPAQMDQVDDMFAAVEEALAEGTVDDFTFEAAGDPDDEAGSVSDGQAQPDQRVVDIESLAAIDDEDAFEAAGTDAGGGTASGKAWRGPSRLVMAGSIAAALIVGLGGAILFRHGVVSAAPATAPLYAAIGLEVNLRGLEFRNVTFQRSFENGLPVLAIHGEIVNITRRNVAVPEIRYGLKDEMNNEVYVWKGRAQAEVLEPDNSASFVTRLQSPPRAAVQALIRFVPENARGGAG